MSLLSLLSTSDVQQHFTLFIREKRKQLKLSRKQLAARSTVPESTIKKFETTGQISFRQLLLIWQSVDDLDRLDQLTKPIKSLPKSIDEVLK